MARIAIVMCLILAAACYFIFSRSEATDLMFGIALLSLGVAALGK